MADAGDRMFCHACGGVWLRNQHGLVCPHCESDFTEIIEIPPDPDEVPPNVDDFPDPPTSVPVERLHSPTHSWADSDPWPHSTFDPDPDGGFGDGYQHHSYRSPDGRFSYHTTSYTHGTTPQRARGPAVDPLMPMIRGLDTIFNGLAETYRQAGQYRQMGEGVRAQRQGQPGEGPASTSATSPQGPRVWHGSFGFSLGGNGGVRSEYHGGLHPRDADGPQTMNTPLRTLGDVLELFRADFGGDGGDPAAGPRTGPNPLAMLSALLNLEHHGDAVYSQEELDRVISQLVDQNVNGTAAPPAPRSAIQALPKKKVDQEMLGNEGRAECSICMEPVELGTEVTVLPCKHWFHYQCIEMWLTQHNTCPHCRRGIDAPAQPEGSSANPVVIEDSPEPVSRRSSTTGNAGNTGSSGGGGLAGWVRSRFGGS